MPVRRGFRAFVLIPGAGSAPDHWHLVVPLLRAAGHDTGTPDLPCESDAGGLPEYVAAAVEAIGDRDDLVVVGQSLGAFTAAAVASTRPTRLLVYVNAMTPARGETPGAWWGAVAETSTSLCRMYARAWSGGRESLAAHRTTREPA